MSNENPLRFSGAVRYRQVGPRPTHLDKRPAPRDCLLFRFMIKPVSILQVRRVPGVEQPAATGINREPNWYDHMHHLVQIHPCTSSTSLTTMSRSLFAPGTILDF